MTNAFALVVAEPEPETRGYLERHLADDGFEVLGAERGREVLELAERVRPDLVLVGGALADASGLDVCRRLREGEPGRSWNRDVPLIIIGDESADAVDRVRALERGCDDYLPRPFFYEELRARIRAVLRRTTAPVDDRLEARRLVVDRRTRRVTVGGDPINLAGREYELLVRLATEPTRVFTKDELLREVWGFRSVGRTRTIDSHASRLRRKLNAAGAEDDYVVNVWGVGYKLIDG
jgi:DNA-binding response OmpR family regulator